MTPETNKTVTTGALRHLMNAVNELHNICSDMIDSKDARLLDATEALLEVKAACEWLENSEIP